MPRIVPSPPIAQSARRTWLGHIGDQAQFNRELSQILMDASKEGERLILATIGDGVGAQVRRAQYKIAVAQLRQLSADMWGGQITAAMQRGIEQAAQRAVDGLIDIDSILVRSVGDTTLRDGLLRAGANGADNIRSRVLNNIKLSPKVYKTEALSRKWVEREVNRGIALNRSAKEIARSVRRFIRPDVRGGVSYAARRLGRTELNNAFHTTTVRAAADQPWIQGFKWNKSTSHKVPDECDEFAEFDHDGLGPGVFRSKGVPGKPHPQCLCYVTTIALDDEEFLDALAAGRYDKYISEHAFI